MAMGRTCRRTDRQLPKWRPSLCRSSVKYAFQLVRLKVYSRILILVDTGWEQQKNLKITQALRGPHSSVKWHRVIIMLNWSLWMNYLCQGTTITILNWMLSKFFINVKHCLVAYYFKWNEMKLKFKTEENKLLLRNIYKYIYILPIPIIKYLTYTIWIILLVISIYKHNILLYNIWRSLIDQ